MNDIYVNYFMIFRILCTSISKCDVYDRVEERQGLHNKAVKTAALRAWSPRTTSLCSHICLVLRDHGVYMYVVYI